MDGQVGVTMKGYDDVVLGDLDGAGHVNEVSVDLARLNPGIDAHATRMQPVPAVGDDQERHSEVNLNVQR